MHQCFSSTVETLEREAASAVIVVKAVSGAQDKSGAQKLENARALYFMLALIKSEDFGFDMRFIYVYCM